MNMQLLNSPVTIEPLKLLILLAVATWIGAELCIYFVRRNLHFRDRDQPLQPGQVWTNGRWHVQLYSYNGGYRVYMWKCTGEGETSVRSEQEIRHMIHSLGMHLSWN